MSVLETLLLALIQGVAEFLPISSKGHLVVAQSLASTPGDPESNMFAIVALHLGSLGAILIYFRKDLLRLLTDRRSEILLVVVGTLPAVVAYAALKKQIEHAFERPFWVGFGFLATAAFIAAADLMATEKRDLAKFGPARALLVGVFQSLALVPGVSRLGMTLGCALLLGLKRQDAIRFSFFLAAAAIAGANLVKGREAISRGTAIDWGPIALGVAVTLATSLAAIHLLAWLSKPRRLLAVSAYLVCAGIFTILYFR